jgi:hypothetical protein
LAAFDRACPKRADEKPDKIELSGQSVNAIGRADGSNFEDM